MAKFDLLRRNFERVFRSDEQALPGYCSAALPGCCFAVSLPAACCSTPIELLLQCANQSKEAAQRCHLFD